MKEKMGIESKRGFFVAFILLLLCSSNLGGAASLETNSNSPGKLSIAESPDQGKEFIVDSQVSRRFLQNNGGSLTKIALAPTGANFCGTYGKGSECVAHCKTCIRKYGKRVCKAQYGCRHGGS